MHSRYSLTIKQVAERAGVSTQTVSRVLNNRPDVSVETRARVQQIITEMGYSPNAIARSLSQGRTHSLGVVVHGLTYYGRAHTLQGIERQANALGYSLQLVLMQDPAQDHHAQIIRNLGARRVDGILWAVPEIGENLAWLDANAELPLPVVFVNMEPRSQWDSVGVDNARGGMLAANHLLEQGCRKVGAITGPLDWWEARQRLHGWRIALEQAGIGADSACQVGGDWSSASGEAGLACLLEANPTLEGVFVANDQMALGALQAARRLGRNIPEDLALVAFDDIPEAAYFYPPLTTIRQDLEAMGAYAVLRLHERIEADVSEIPEPRQPTWIEPELVVRVSSLWKQRNC